MEWYARTVAPLVGNSPSGDWSGQAGCLAAFQAGTWLFVLPRDGMSVLDLSTGQIVRYLDGWQVPAAVAAATGGSVIDSQARNAITQIVAALTTAGILSPG
ncbi:MAG: DUF2793 domain-containing protein [Alteraurantiacibacter sp.]